MKPLRHLRALAVPLPMAHLDTDQIVPARFLSRSRSEGFADALFHDLRYREDGSTASDFVLNRYEDENSLVLVTGRNFGCGSSREHAVWALQDSGIHCIVAASFADIFHANALKNGVLPVTLPEARVVELLDHLAQSPMQVELDVAEQTLQFGAQASDSFELTPFAKQCLLEGLSEIDVTLKDIENIKRFETRHEAQFHWVFSRTH